MSEKSLANTEISEIVQNNTNVKIEEILSEKQSELLRNLKIIYLAAREANLSASNHEMIKQSTSILEQMILDSND